MNVSDFLRTELIFIVVALDPDIVFKIQNEPTVDYCEEYDRINLVLNKIADHAVDLIKSIGYGQALCQQQTGSI